jgi:hypothetical protein
MVQYKERLKEKWFECYSTQPHTVAQLRLLVRQADRSARGGWVSTARIESRNLMRQTRSRENSARASSQGGYAISLWLLTLVV